MVVVIKLTSPNYTAINHEWKFEDVDELKQFFTSLQMFYSVYKFDKDSYMSIIEWFLRPMLNDIKSGKVKVE